VTDRPELEQRRRRWAGVRPRPRSGGPCHGRTPPRSDRRRCPPSSPNRSAIRRRPSQWGVSSTLTRECCLGLDDEGSMRRCDQPCASAGSGSRPFARAAISKSAPIRPPDTDAHIMACTVNGRTGRDRPGSGNRTRTVSLDTDSLPGALAKMAKGMRSRTSAVSDVKMV